MKKQKYSYDEQCEFLARYFYPDWTDDDLAALAQEIQDVVEAASDDDERPWKIAPND